MSLVEYQKFVTNVASAIARQFRTDEAVPAAEAATTAAPASAAGPVDAYVLDREKLVWTFPDTAARLIEEMP